MELELWWLLLIPLVFAMGWFAARVDVKYLLKESGALPGSYFKGLNFLLNEQPDKAIEAFIEVVQVDPQTIDLHIALGSLFRRQGEIERAIRMHQNLLDRPDLPIERRMEVTYELALDFHRAGLLDRAEEIFGKLYNTPYESRALSHLLQIYEQENEWDKAISITRKVQALSQQSHTTQIAQYYCELATSEMGCSRLDAAEDYLRQALAENGRCARANILLGDIAFLRQNYLQALERWREIGKQNPPYISLVAEKVAEACKRSEQATAAFPILETYHRDTPSPDILNALFELTLENRGPAAAAALLRDELKRNPTLLGLEKLLEAQSLAAVGDRRHDIELVKSLVQQHTKRLGMYRCERCGFRAKQYYWRCPGCGQWESYSPHRTEAMEGF